MGFFAKLKKLFSNSIDMTPDMSTRLISLYGLKMSRIKVNKHLVVEKDWCVVFVCGDKPCDILMHGTYTLNNTTIPTTFKKCRMNRENKRGKSPKSFKADIYFVNLSKFKDNAFRSVVPFKIKSTRFGKIKGYVEGWYDARILDTETFMKLLLLDLPYIKAYHPMKYIKYWLSDEIRQILEHSKLNFAELLTRPKDLYNLVNETILDKLEEYGLEVSNVRIDSLILTKRVQKLVNEYLAEYKESIRDINDKVLISNQGDLVTSLDSAAVENINEFREETISDNSFTEANRGMQVGGVSDDMVLRRGSTPSQLQTGTDIKVNTEKRNIAEEFGNTTNKKQCKYCDAMIGVEFKYCPNCGFKQDN